MVTIGEAFAPVEGIVYSAEDVKIKIGNNLIGPAGELHLTECSLIWSCDERNSSISIPWPRVGVQAISSNPEKCIYLMLDINLVWPGFYDGRPQNNGNENGEGGREEEEDEHDEGHESDGSENEMTEIWLQPSAPQIVDEIYNAMRECQSLNPDPGAVSEDEDYMEAEEDELQEVDEMRNLQLDDEDKFADAEE
ncbi:methylosome subunit pICln isoform X1 [Wyeomyia smithii]|uniref:methylosome subunit pICln isoform X1 n=1 Tax=Wyeomyia smithii TaxID=174621 RepID=UPI002467DE84|nr:methylosome subunit pICln isoform X1 [Wyeomyia smithii]XP_055534076.1 methylosome subunit pICln isoform X1 [Wyeomyia smithii]XP_055534077.1 methylosome subunit pICln isoform X1 [Wyeomyia smithii]